MLKNKKGFTLIELMIVIAIIGILAAIAIPNFLNYQCKARQAEAKTNLGSIRTAEEAYYAEFSTYSITPAKIGFATKGGSKYTYSITHSTSTFTASATSVRINKANPDKWTMTDTGTLTNVTSACAG